MTRDEILNRIAIKKHGRHFNEIFAIKSRAEILQQALDEALEQVNNNAVLHSVVPSTSELEISQEWIKAYYKARRMFGGNGHVEFNCNRKRYLVRQLG